MQSVYGKITEFCVDVPVHEVDKADAKGCEEVEQLADKVAARSDDAKRNLEKTTITTKKINENIS